MTKHTHMGKLTILKMTMENWEYVEGNKYSEVPETTKLFRCDLDSVNTLIHHLKGRGHNSMT